MIATANLPRNKMRLFEAVIADGVGPEVAIVIFADRGWLPVLRWG